MNDEIFRLPETLKGIDLLENVFVYQDGDYTPEVQLMVTNMLAAIHLVPNENITLLPIPSGKNLLLWNGDFTTKNVLIFGLNPTRLGLKATLKPYKLYNLEGCSVILCHKLTDFVNDKDKKMTLWKILQHIYLKKDVAK